MLQRIDVKLWQASKECADFVKRFERLELKAYKCAAGKWTIGYGHTTAVGPGDVIRIEDADELLRQDLKVCEAAIRHWVKVPLSQGEFDALVSFIFNIGAGNFSKSTLLRVLNEGQYKEAGRQLLRWDKVNGKPLRGLTRRRVAERRIWSYSIYQA